MKLSVSGIIVVFSLAIVSGKQRRGAFHMSNYLGPQHNSQIAIYYTDNYKQPKCYGTLINWNVVLVPCSCVIKNPPQDWATWWDHRPKKKVTKDHPSNYKALPMSYEYHNDSVKKMRVVPVTGIEVSPKCDTLFQYNMAKIKLEKPIEGTKLAWVALTSEERLKTIIYRVMEASRLRGRCLVHFWSVYGIDILNTPQRPILNSELLSKSEWVACRSMVCPGISPPNNAKRHQERNVCNNAVTGSRICVNWKPVVPFCRLIPGTPVFCVIDGLFSGVIGFIHNTSMLCDPVRGRNAVLEGIDLAIPLIKNDAPVHEIIPP